MFTACFLFVGMTCSRYKGPLVYSHQGIGDCAVLFCKSPLEVVVVVSICIFLICHLYFVFCFCGPALQSPLMCCHLQGLKFDILWHTMLGPIPRVLYIFYYIKLVLPMFCCRVAALIVNNNMYTCLV